jgi:hypothetical protein
MKRLGSWVFERHLVLVVSLGRLQLWILKLFKSLVMRWGWVLTFRKCRVGGRGVWIFEKVRPGWAYMHIPDLIPG